MDPDKVVEFVQKYITSYFRIFLNTAARPWVAPESALLPSPVEGDAPSISGTERRQLSAALWLYVVLSVVLGGTINLLLFSNAAPSMLQRTIFLIFIWLGYTAIVSWVCQVMGKSAGFLETTSYALPAVATAYVLSNFLTIVFSPIGGRLGLLADEDRDFLYNGITVLLIGIYTALAVKPLHGLRWWQVITVGLVSAFLLAVFLFMMVSMQLNSMGQ